MPTARQPAVISDASDLGVAYGAGGCPSPAMGATARGPSTGWPRRARRRRATHPGSRAVSPRLCDLAVTLGGAFGAAYGIGVMALDLLDRSGDPAKCAVMRAVKAALGPKGILKSVKVVR